MKSRADCTGVGKTYHDTPCSTPYSHIHIRVYFLSSGFLFFLFTMLHTCVHPHPNQKHRWAFPPKEVFPTAIISMVRPGHQSRSSTSTVVRTHKVSRIREQARRGIPDLHHFRMVDFYFSHPLVFRQTFGCLIIGS